MKSSADTASVRGTVFHAVAASHWGIVMQLPAPQSQLVGAGDRPIHPPDGQEVALAAIQALVAQSEELREENARLAARVSRLESAVWSPLRTPSASRPARYRN